MDTYPLKEHSRLIKYINAIAFRAAFGLSDFFVGSGIGEGQPSKSLENDGIPQIFQGDMSFPDFG